MDLKTLCEAQGASGREEPVRRMIYEACVSALGPSAETIGRLGNVLAHRAGKGPSVLLAAHMDEVGLMAVSATEEGLLRVRALGGIDPRVLVSKRVTVGYGKDAVPGVIGAMAIHQQTADDRKKALPITELYVDIGAKDKAEAERHAPGGTPITFDTAYTPFGDGLVYAKALDDRVGVYNLLRLLTAPTGRDVTFAFTSQEEVGCRGAAGAAFGVQPDIAFALEGTTANDAGDVPEPLRVCSCGKGVVISFMDGTSIADAELYRELNALAEREGIAHQPKLAVTGGNDAGAMQRAGVGARACALSVPCRYIHSPASVCALADIEAQHALVKAFLAQ